MEFHVDHTTMYRYAVPATTCHNLAHLSPRSTPGQSVVSHELAVSPTPDDLTTSKDLYGNTRTYFSIERPHEGLEVSAHSVFELRPREPDPDSTLPWESARDAVGPPSVEREFVLGSPHVPPLVDLAIYARPSFTPGRPLIEAVTELTTRINTDFEFLPGSTTVSTPISIVMQQRNGVCQDFAHVAVGCLRSMGLAARYVSGYIETLPPPGMDKLVGADATHAWCAVRSASGRWIDLDPTNDVVSPTSHLTVAWGRDYGDVVPLRGVVVSKGAAAELVVEVDVVRRDHPTDTTSDSQVTTDGDS